MQLDRECEAQGSIIGGLLSAAQGLLEGFSCWKAEHGTDSSRGMHAAAHLAAMALRGEVNISDACKSAPRAAHGKTTAAEPVPAECPICFDGMPA